VEPEQVAVHLRTAFPDRPSWHVCHEMIYQALYQGSKGGLSRQLTRRLCTRRLLRKRRRRADHRRSRFITPEVLIDHQPPAVLSRTRCGDWEGDLVVGAQGRSAIASLVDRASRDLLPVNRTAEALRDALIATLTSYPNSCGGR
jgi:IS30 family transposase